LIGRRGKKKALIAVGHKILEACYYVLKEKVSYNELGANYLIEKKRKSRINYLTRQLNELGYDVEKIEKVA
jgi:hypothetical protein